MRRSYPSIGNTGNQRRSQQSNASQHSRDYIPPNWAKCIDFNSRVHLQLYQPGRDPEDSEHNKRNWIYSTNPDCGNSTSVQSNSQASGGSRANYKQRHGFQRKSTKAERQTGNALSAAAETTKPTMSQIYMATCSESKQTSAAVQWASIYRRAHLGNSSYHTNQHSPPPWPGDDICKESNGQSLGWVFEHLKPVDKSEVLVVPMKVYDLVLGLPWFMVRNPQIDWSKGRLTALWTPNVLQWGKIPEADRTSPLPERGEGHKNHKSCYRIQSSLS